MLVPPPFANTPFYSSFAQTSRASETSYWVRLNFLDRGTGPPRTNRNSHRPACNYVFRQRPDGTKLTFPRLPLLIEIQEIDAAPQPLVTQPEPKKARTAHSARFAFLVAAGIFLSRIFGLVRDRVFAHYFGNSDAADAFKAAFRIPNFLQNLFGEGVLSASFIPVYANLLAREDKEEANRTAGAVAALLALVTSLIVLAGVLATPYLIDAIAPGFHGEKRELTIRLVRILFPGAGLLVFSAWCLGILNSHHKFFLPYVAPVIWNLTMIGTLLGYGRHYAQYPLAVILAWGSVAGSALQVFVQLPSVLRLVGKLRVRLRDPYGNVKTVVNNFVPVFIGRGVLQISAYVDALLASLLPTGAVAALSYAQTLYTLPVSLFGMSISAAELPVMSGRSEEHTS